ncbi:MAG TPA: extracellular solute-binding protein [Ilumatobacter sp.]|nr:extracellular solute-binding protein [Ilumatobacter sp.]
MNTTRARRTAALLTAAAVLAAACGGDDDTAESPTTVVTTGSTTLVTAVESVETTVVPVVEPVVTTVAPSTAATEPDEPGESVDDLIAASQAEDPTLVVYGNLNDQMWEGVIAAFAEQYPWVQIEWFDLGGVEAFQRYLSESATGVASADLIIASEATGWLDLVDRGEVLPYVDASLAELPDFARQAPGVYALAVDPMIAVYNQHLVAPDDQPDTLAGIAELAGSLPGSLGTVEVENSQAYLANYGFVTAGGDDAWSTLAALAPFTKAESGSGALLGKALSGEYPAVFFVSGSLRALIDNPDEAAGDVLDYKYLVDATPLVPRGMGVTATANSPAAAKLFVNFMLSPTGAGIACANGLTPYRSDVECGFGYQAIVDQVGADNVILVNYSADAEAQRDAVQARWNETFGR